jgi:hypothetical protein
LTALCPDRWLDESQRFEKQCLHECAHYRNAIRNAFTSMNLQVEEIVGRLPDLVAYADMTPPGEPGLWLPIGIDEFGRQVWHDLAGGGFPLIRCADEVGWHSAGNHIHQARKGQ